MRANEREEDLIPSPLHLKQFHVLLFTSFIFVQKSFVCIIEQKERRDKLLFTRREREREESFFLILRKEVYLFPMLNQKEQSVTVRKKAGK